MKEESKCDLHHYDPCKCGEHMCGDYMYKEHKEQHSCCYSEEMLKLADKAWMEVLKEKMKAEIEKVEGAELEELAKIVGKANGEKWKNRISAKMQKEEYQDSLKEYFSSHQ